MTKILTGDSDRVTCFICKQIGLPADNPSSAATPCASTGRGACRADHRVREALAGEGAGRLGARPKGHTVGYMGDGVNAAAMKESDAGILADDAVDIAEGVGRTSSCSRRTSASSTRASSRAGAPSEHDPHRDDREPRTSGTSSRAR